LQGALTDKLGQTITIFIGQFTNWAISIENLANYLIMIAESKAYIGNQIDVTVTFSATKFDLVSSQVVHNLIGVRTIIVPKIIILRRPMLFTHKVALSLFHNS